MSACAYTYRGKRRVPLSRLTTRFVSEASKGALLAHDFNAIEGPTSDTWFVTTTDTTFDQDLRRARRLAAAYAEYIDTDTGSPFRVTDRIFVRFKCAADATDNAVHHFAMKYGLSVVRRFSDRDLLFRVPAKEDPTDMVCRLTEEAADVVDVVDHDLNIEPELSTALPATPYAGQQWYWMSTPPPHPPSVARGALVDCAGAWEVAGMGSSDVVIAVIDCGFNLSDPNFAEGKFAGWAAFADRRLRVSPPRNEMNFHNPHGTLCAALAAASANEVGGVGAAPGCRLLPVKWDLRNSESSFVDVINFVRAEADVVSCSWNRQPPDAYWPVVVVDALRDAAANGGRRGRGMIWCWSAGNCNVPIEYSGTTPVPTVLETDSLRKIVVRTATQFTNSFVGIPGVLHIGAISSNARRCHYSNYGAGLEFVAPSTNWHTYGRQAFDEPPLTAPQRRGLAAFGGTSAAAPIVAGVAGLVISANRNLTANDAISILRRTADRENLDMTPYEKCGRTDDHPNAFWDVSPIEPFHHGRFEWKLPDGDWSAWFGFGKVNARKAVTAAVSRAALHP